VARLEDFLAAREEGAPDARVWSGSTGSPCFALRFANASAGRVFAEELSRVCPRDGMVWFDLVDHPAEWLSSPARSGVLVTVARDLDRQPPLLGWGTPVPTRVHSYDSGRYFLVPFPLARLRAQESAAVAR
jgi:hypothetical protein